MFKRIKESPWSDVLGLTLISALAYLPDILYLGYYRDDWYYMYDGLVAGPQVFIEMFRHLRPARGPLYALYFSLFGTEPLPYHLMLSVWRLIGAFGMYGLFGLLWPGRRSARFFVSCMFLLYPGFLWWVAAIEYQPMVISLGLQVWSIAITLIAIRENGLKRFVYYALAVLTGVYALALVDYSIGMELLRLLSIYLFVYHNFAALDFRGRISKTFWSALPFLLIPVLFLIWHELLFENWRRAGDVGLQLSASLGSPHAIFGSLIRLLQSAFNVSIFAWGVPFSQYFFSSRLRDIAVSLFFAVIGVALFLFFQGKLDSSVEEENRTGANWQFEAFLIGMMGVLAGVAPIVAANRVVAFERFSHYTLPASVAGVLLLGGVVYSFPPSFMRSAICSLVIGLAVLTHRSVSTQARAEESVINNFWWQVSWRAPDIKDGALLVVDYPFNYADDSDIVYGPANFIYNPEKQPQLPVQIYVNSVAMEYGTVQDILVGRAVLHPNFYGAHEYLLDYGNVTVITHSSTSSCVHIVDGRWADMSYFAEDWVLTVARKSNIQNVIPADSGHVPPVYLFGTEPPHDWCYYYQKADLARQQGDWETAARLGDAVQAGGFQPNDQIEWMPFLQAYVLMDDFQQVKALSKFINTEAYYKRQACDILTSMPEHGYQPSPQMDLQVRELFCPN